MARKEERVLSDYFSAIEKTSRHISKSKEHVKRLKEDLDASGIPLETAGLIGWRLHSTPPQPFHANGGPGYIIPYTFPEKLIKGLPEFARYKKLPANEPIPDRPAIPRQTDKVKYLQPTGSKNQAYICTPLRPLIRFEQDEFLIITEGEKKAVCALLKGFPTIAFGGVNSWHHRKDFTLLPEVSKLLEHMTNLKTIYIAFDAERETNLNVGDAFKGLCAVLFKARTDVEIREIVFPEDQPKLDDFLVEYGSNGLSELMEKAEVVAGVKQPLSQVLQEERVSAFLGEHDVVFYDDGYYVREKGSSRPYEEQKRSYVETLIERFLANNFCDLSPRAASDCATLLRGQSSVIGEAPCYRDGRPFDLAENIIFKDGIYDLETEEFDKTIPEDLFFTNYSVGLEYLKGESGRPKLYDLDLGFDPSVLLRILAGSIPGQRRPSDVTIPYFRGRGGSGKSAMSKFCRLLIPNSDNVGMSVFTNDKTLRDVLKYSLVTLLEADDQHGDKRTSLISALKSLTGESDMRQDGKFVQSKQYKNVQMRLIIVSNNNMTFDTTIENTRIHEFLFLGKDWRQDANCIENLAEWLMNDPALVPELLLQLKMYHAEGIPAAPKRETRDDHVYFVETFLEIMPDTAETRKASNAELCEQGWHVPQKGLTSLFMGFLVTEYGTDMLLDEAKKKKALMRWLENTYPHIRWRKSWKVGKDEVKTVNVGLKAK